MSGLKLHRKAGKLAPSPPHNWSILTRLAVLCLFAGIAHADTIERTMSFKTWARIFRTCHARIAERPVPNADGTLTFRISGDAAQLGCVDLELAKPTPKAKETP